MSTTTVPTQGPIKPNVAAPTSEDVIGADLASAATISPVTGAHRVTGAVTVTTVNLPYAGFRGRLVLMAVDGFALATGGNVGAAMNVAANTGVELEYDGTKWWPVGAFSATADAVLYTPSNPNDWSEGAPADVKTAVDRLATRATTQRVGWSPVDAAGSLRVSANINLNLTAGRGFHPLRMCKVLGARVLYDLTRGTKTIGVDLWNPKGTRVASGSAVCTSTTRIATILFDEPVLILESDLYKLWAISYKDLTSVDTWYLNTPAAPALPMFANWIVWTNHWIDNYPGAGDTYPSRDNNLVAPVEPILAELVAIAPRTTTKRFAIAGQSNAVGQGTNIQALTVPRGKPCPMVFSGDYYLRPLEDPVGGLSIGWDTSLPNFNNIPGGSVWPLVAQSWVDASKGKLDFVPCAESNSRIASWLPGANHQDRTTLYGEMINRCLQAGAINGVLWWQGEGDIVDGTSPSTYVSRLNTIADAVFADLGCKLYPATIPSWFSGANNAARLAFNTAVRATWGVGHVGTGPELAGLTYDDDSPHFTGDAGLAAAAAIWYSAVLSTF